MSPLPLEVCTVNYTRSVSTAAGSVIIAARSDPTAARNEVSTAARSVSTAARKDMEHPYTGGSYILLLIQ